MIPVLYPLESFDDSERNVFGADNQSSYASVNDDYFCSHKIIPVLIFVINVIVLVCVEVGLAKILGHLEFLPCIGSK